MQKSAEQLKLEDLWIKAWCAVAGDGSDKSAHIATRYADQAVSDFKDRFPPVFTPTHDKQPD